MNAKSIGLSKIRYTLFVTLLLMNTILFSQEKINFDNDYILIEKLPTSSQILSVKFICCDFPSTILSEQEFLNLLDHAKVVEPENELLFNWNYSPWYMIEFTTSCGNYHLQLYLGGLGVLTLPNGEKGAVLLDLTKE